jgi:predicted nucleic acid-binding protein
MIPQSVFLDTNFLIASQQKNHIFHEESRLLLDEFCRSNWIPVAHPLVFDEFWYVFMGLYKDYTSGKMNKFLIKATNKVFDFHNFKILKTALLQEDLLDTLEIMYKRKLRPRDALIVTIMKKEGIRNIASFDLHFDNIPTIKRLF